MSIDVNECPNGGYNACRCERCDTCSHRKHTNIHGAGFPDGNPSKYGHEFSPKVNTLEELSNERNQTVHVLRPMPSGSDTAQGKPVTGGTSIVSDLREAGIKAWAAAKQKIADAKTD